MPSTPPRPGKRSRSRSSEKSTPPNSPSSDERPLRKGQHSEASQSPPPPQPLKAHAGGKNKKSRSQERSGKSTPSEHQHSTSPPPSPSLSSSQSSVNGSGKAHKGKAKSAMSEEDEAILMLITSIVDDWQHGSRMLSEQMIRVILRRVRPVLMSQPMLVRVEAPVNVCGDLHGQITDLVEILKAGGLPPDSRYLFLGDYVDRGKYGSEVITVLLGFKVLYPESIYLLRGNHEADNVCRIYGFFDEVKRRFSVKLFKEFTDVFNCLPISALIEDIALCMHGGLSPELRDVRQIEQVPRPLVVPDEGLACDILWSDPEEGSSGWQPSERGVSFTFGADVAKRMCDVLGIDIVLRAHQVVDNGYSFFADRRVVTIFSASNYCGEFSNSGAMMVMDETCKCSFQIFKPQYGQKLK